MAQKLTPPSSVYAFEDEEANQRYQDAYNQLLAAVDARQEKPLFDPVWLAAAKGFSGPNRTGSFFESLGNVAGNVATAQEAQQAKEIELAKMRMELAGMGVQQANQRAAMRMYKEGATPPAAPSATPSAAPQSESDSALKTMGIEGEGIQMFPPQGLIPKKQFVAAQLLKGGNVPDAEIAYQDYLRKDIELGQNGIVIQRSTGRGFEIPDPTPVQVPFLSLQGELFQTTKSRARELDRLTSIGDNEGRVALENKIRGLGKPAPKPAPTAAPAPAPAPYVPPPRPVTENPPMGAVPMTTPEDQERITTGTTNPADFGYKPAQVGNLSAPAVVTAKPANFGPPPALSRAAVTPSEPPPSAGMMSPAEQERRKAKAESDRKIAEAKQIALDKAEIDRTAGAQAKFEEGVGGKRAELAISTETEIAQNAKRAGTLFSAADTVINSVKRSPNYFGVFAKPGLLNAAGATLAEAAKPGGRFTLVDVEQRVLQAMPGTTQENLLDREKAASALAEIELGYTQTYLAKQGAVTEGERKIVRAIPGGLSSSPKFLEIKSKLIRERAQYDMDVNTAFEEYMRAKPNGNALDFTRNNTLYKEIRRNFEITTAEIAKTLPALPSKERPAAPVNQPSNPAASYAEGLLRRRSQ
jgi:hypothetical protein